MAPFLATVGAIVMLVLSALACGGDPAEPTAPSPPHVQPSTPTAAGTHRAVPPASRRAVRIVFVDVGQGDAILVRSGAREMLVDGGADGAAAAVIAAARGAGIADLDLVVTSHMHADHIGATDELVRFYRPERALIAGGCDGALRRAFKVARTHVRQARRGDTFTLGRVKVKVLSPADCAGEANEESLVLLLEVAGRRLLLTGDLTGPNEAAVGEICSRGPPIYLLKVAHHGSRHSTASGFLAAVAPAFAIVCVGPNPYGHPTRETIGRLTVAGACTYSTQHNGTIALTIGASGATTWRFARSSKALARASREKGGAGG